MNLVWTTLRAPYNKPGFARRVRKPNISNRINLASGSFKTVPGHTTAHILSQPYRTPVFSEGQYGRATFPGRLRKRVATPPKEGEENGCHRSRDERAEISRKEDAASQAAAAAMSQDMSGTGEVSDKRLAHTRANPRRRRLPTATRPPPIRHRRRVTVSKEIGRPSRKTRRWRRRRGHSGGACLEEKAYVLRGHVCTAVREK